MIEGQQVQSNGINLFFLTSKIKSDLFAPEKLVVNSDLLCIPMTYTYENGFLS